MFQGSLVSAVAEVYAPETGQTPKIMADEAIYSRMTPRLGVGFLQKFKSFVEVKRGLVTGSAPVQC